MRPLFVSPGRNDGVQEDSVRSSFVFLAPGLFSLFWVLPLTAALFIYGRYRKKRDLGVFYPPGPCINSPGPRRSGEVFHYVLWLCAVLLILLALVRPAWNPRSVEVMQKGRDVVFLLDVSKSMLARDILPSRLERAKTEIIDTIPVLQGNRVALVVFAGGVQVLCPLTRDYSFFRRTLEEVSVYDAPSGGTMIGDAIRKVLKDVFDERENYFKDIFLITDGEDHDSFPVEAAQQADRRGVRIIAVGLGDARQGERIPLQDEAGTTRFLTDKGQEVWSRLNPDILSRLALATPGGRYIQAGTGPFNLGDIYARFILEAEQTDLGSETIVTYTEGFQVFLAAAFLFVCAAYLRPGQ